MKCFFRRNFLNLSALGFLVVGCLASNLFENGPTAEVLLRPHLRHPIGTDSLGRDMLLNILSGGQRSLLVSFAASALACLLGSTYGAVAGLFGRWTDRILMRLTDVIFSIPYPILMILVSLWVQDTASFRSVRSTMAVILALALAGWVRIARVVRAQVLKVKQEGFVEASQAIGATRFRLWWRHILPHLSGSILVLSLSQIPVFILHESFLSFIGLGIQPPQTSWGLLIAEGWPALRYHPHLILAPVLCLAATTVTLNQLGDNLSDQMARLKS